MKWGLMALAAMTIAAPADAQFAGEHLAAPADPAMVLGFKIASAPMQEYIARTESVDAWTRMVTVVQLPWRPGVTPGSILERFKAGWGQTCPGGSAGEIASVTVAGHDAADVRLDCPLNPRTGKPETMIGRAVLGDEGMYMVQAATRRAPGAADMAWARRVIAGTTLCATASAESRCRATRDPAIGNPL